MAEWLFRVRDPWDDEVGLTHTRWRKLVAKHRELAVLGAPDEAVLIGMVRRTIEHPDLVYDGRSAPDSKVFYSRAGVFATTPYTRCRIAVVVRYTHQPASLPSVYLPVEIRGNLGTLLYERGRS